MNKKIKVILADRHTLVREGLRHVLASEAEIEVVGLVRDGPEAVNLAARLQPDVVVLTEARMSQALLTAVAAREVYASGDTLWRDGRRRWRRWRRGRRAKTQARPGRRALVDTAARMFPEPPRAGTRSWAEAVMLAVIKRTVRGAVGFVWPAAQGFAKGLRPPPRLGWLRPMGPGPGFSGPLAVCHSRCAPAGSPVEHFTHAALPSHDSGHERRKERAE